MKTNKAKKIKKKSHRKLDEDQQSQEKREKESSYDKAKTARNTLIITSLKIQKATKIIQLDIVNKPTNEYTHRKQRFFRRGSNSWKRLLKNSRSQGRIG
jgi:hypothetical protein